MRRPPHPDPAAAGLSATGKKAYRRERLVAASFVVGSALLPASAWIGRARFGRVGLPPWLGLTLGAITVALLVSLGLGLRRRLDRSSTAAVDEGEFWSMRLLAVTLPCALAEASALVVALVGSWAGFPGSFLALLLPPALVLALSWPRLAEEVEAEAEFRKGWRAREG